MIVVSAAAALLAVQAVGVGGDAQSLGALGNVSAQQAGARSLAPNEILLELGAMGSETSAADLAEVSLTIKGRGMSEEAARAAHDAILAKVRAAASAAGVVSADIEPGDPDVGPDSDGGMVDLMEPLRPLRPGQSAQATDQPFAAASTVKLRVRAIDRLESLEEAVRKAGAETAGEPKYSSENTAAARQGARRKAIAQARTDAETYAAALNMRVVRILRVTERTGADMMTMMMSEMVGNESRMSQMFEGNDDGRVPSVVFVGVDFVLGPR